MKPYRSTLILVGLFFAGLIVLWRLESSGVLTEAQRLEHRQLILPGLIDVPESSITRVEIAREGRTLAFERRGKDRWQMVEPVDAAADSTSLETLVRNLKGLRRSPDTGTINAPGESYGLNPPAAVVRVWGESGPAPGSSSSSSAPLAVLEIGKIAHDFGYARPAGAQAIDVVSNKMLEFVDRPPADWRERNLVPVPSFQVTRFSVKRQGLDLTAERSAGGQWRLTSPVPFPGNGPKIESLLGALSAIRVLDGDKGFVADDVKDLAPYGLAPPEATVELFTADESGAPVVLHVGKKPADHPDSVYVQRGGQDDVLMVSDRFLSEIPKDSIALRAQDVADIVPAAVSKVEIKAIGTTFTLVKQASGWALRSPREETADPELVRSLLTAIRDMKTSEFLPFRSVIEPSLDPPVMDVQVWQSPSSPDAAATKREPADGAGESLAFHLRIGRHDRLKKTVYGQVEGDSVILALPDSLLDHLPRNRYAYRDRGVLALNPASVTRLTLVREGKTIALEPDSSAKTPNRWRMIEPVKAPADTVAITQVLTLLSDLRAEAIVAESPADVKPFGLDHPPVIVSWTLDKPQAETAARGTLKIGGAVPGIPGTFYAAVEGQPFLFALGTAAIQPLAAEFHETQVISLRPDSIRRLTFRAPGRTLAFARAAQPTGSPADWRPEPGTDASKIDMSRFNDLVAHLAQLRSPRFFQYDGPFPVMAGLARPRLVIAFDTADGKTQTLRLGATLGGMVLAATGGESSGPIFLLPANAWDALIQMLSPAGELPDDVFAP